MRSLLVGTALFVAVLVPILGRSQVYQLPTPVPQLTAASASWQMNGEPVFYAGAFYYPTGPTVYFDGFVMVRSGIYRGVPIYSDTTLEPYSIVFVPVGGNVMRPYERRREGELAGTVGSRMPSFPIQRDVEVSAAAGTTGILTPPHSLQEPPALAEVERPVGTVGTVVRTPAIPAAPMERARARRSAVETIPRPQSNAGVWIEYNGGRWYSAGSAVMFSPERFTPIGEYRGFPVYRDASGASNQIYVPAVHDGPLVPYAKR